MADTNPFSGGVNTSQMPMPMGKPKSGKDKHGHPNCSSAGDHHAEIAKAYGGGKPGK